MVIMLYLLLFLCIICLFVLFDSIKITNIKMFSECLYFW